MKEVHASIVRKREWMHLEAGLFDDEIVEVTTSNKDCKIHITTQALDLHNNEMNIAIHGMGYAGFDMSIFLCSCCTIFIIMQLKKSRKERSWFIIR